MKTKFIMISILPIYLTCTLCQQNRIDPLIIKADTAVDIWDGTTVTKPSTYDDGGVTLADGNSYIPISTAAEYVYIANNNDAWSKNYILMSDLDFSICKTNNISAPLIAAGDTSKSFTGILDGNGHKISNLYHYYKADKFYLGSYYVGLFGSNEGTICNLVVSNISLTAEHTNLSKDFAGLYIGTIAGLNEGQIYNITIMNCNILGINDKTIYAGGVAGYQRVLSNKEANIQNCAILESEVNFSGPTNILGNGGLVMASGSGGTVSNCYAYNSNLISSGRGTTNTSDYQTKDNMEELVNELNEVIGDEVFSTDGTINRTPEMETAEKIANFYADTTDICDDIDRAPELLEEYENLSDSEKELFQSSGMYDRLMYLMEIYNNRSAKVSTSQSNLLSFNISNINKLSTLCILGITSLTSIIIYMFLAKKHKQNL